MHEYSIVSSLLDVCEKQAKKNSAQAIKSVNIKIGRLSGIEPHFMQSCFDVFKEDTICENATLHMEIIDTKIYCNACKQESIVYKNNFFCPTCKSPDTKILSGQEMIIQSIEILGNKI